MQAIGGVMASKLSRVQALNNDSEQRRDDGTYEEGTVNYLVDKQLREMAEKITEHRSMQMTPKKNED